MRIGVRGHDIPSANPEELCRKLKKLGVSEIQFIAHKSFPKFCYSEESIRKLAEVFEENRIHVAVYGCYIDPLTREGENRFLEHIRYAEILHAGVIATESAVERKIPDEDTYQRLVHVFRRFTEEGRRRGVRIAIETVSAHPICNPEITKRFLDDVQADNLRVILDPQNLLQTDENESDRRNRTEEAIRLYGDRIAAIHLKDKNPHMDDPAIIFAEMNDETVLITEGLTGEILEGVLESWD